MWTLWRTEFTTKIQSNNAAFQLSSKICKKKHINERWVYHYTPTLILLCHSFYWHRPFHEKLNRFKKISEKYESKPLASIIHKLTTIIKTVTPRHETIEISKIIRKKNENSMVRNLTSVIKVNDGPNTSSFKSQPPPATMISGSRRARVSTNWSGKRKLGWGWLVRIRPAEPDSGSLYCRLNHPLGSIAFHIGLKSS